MSSEVHDSTLTAVALVRAWRRQSESEANLLLRHSNPSGVALALAMFASELVEEISELTGEDPDRLVGNWQAQVIQRAADDPEDSD